MTLRLLRHAPVLAEDGLCYGATDLAASPAETRAIALRVAPTLPPGIALHCSPLVRCATLAQAIAALRPDLHLKIEPRIAEMGFGAWEGRAWRGIERAAFDAWTADFADAQPGGDGESVRAFMRRVGAAWDAWRTPREDTLWVTHAGVIRAAWLLQAGIRCPDRADQWPRRPIAFGECVEID